MIRKVFLSLIAICGFILVFQSCGKRKLKDCCISQNLVIIPSHANYFVPNIFTPNADSINDLLFLYGTDFISAEWKILDGKTVLYETNDFTIGWDGTHEGNLVKEKNYDLEATIESQHGNYEISGKVCVVTECFHENNFSQCMFGSQWDGFDYDNSIPSQETIGLCN